MGLTKKLADFISSYRENINSEIDSFQKRAALKDFCSNALSRAQYSYAGQFSHHASSSFSQEPLFSRLRHQYNILAGKILEYL